MKRGNIIKMINSLRYFMEEKEESDSTEKNNENDDERIEAIIEYAKEMHNTARDGKPQLKWGKLNYFNNHPFEMYEQIKDAGYPFEYQATALCHDLLEDTKATPEKIEELAGKKVLNAVKILTKKEGESKEEYLKNIDKNDICKLVKAYDRLNNMKSLLTDAPKEMALEYLAKKYIEDTQYFYKDYKFKKLDVMDELEKIKKGLKTSKKHHD